MFSLDDRAGNVMTTVVVFVVAGAILYLARGAFLILLLSLLFAHLLEPAVTWLQQHSWLGRKNRTWAITQLYLIGTLVFGSLAYAFGARFATQIRSLNAAVPDILDGLSSGTAAVGLAGKHGLSVVGQLRLQDFLASHHDLITGTFERGTAALAHATASAIWLFAIPILAIFFLLDGRPMADALIEAVEQRRSGTRLRAILRQVDTMLAKYIRAQLALAGLSFVFYSASMLALRFPDAIALGALGGALEFLPTVGWIASALAILTTGFLTHSHWIWMAGLVVVWRLVLDYSISPRIMGHSLELPPLTVTFALMVGAEIGGIAGLYLSVPAVAILRIVWLECFPTRGSSAAKSDQPLMQVKT